MWGNVMSITGKYKGLRSPVWSDEISTASKGNWNECHDMPWSHGPWQERETKSFKENWFVTLCVAVPFMLLFNYCIDMQPEDYIHTQIKKKLDRKKAENFSFFFLNKVFVYHN